MFLSFRGVMWPAGRHMTGGNSLSSSEPGSQLTTSQHKPVENSQFLIQLSFWQRIKKRISLLLDIFKSSSVSCGNYWIHSATAFMCCKTFHQGHSAQWLDPPSQSHYLSKPTPGYSKMLKSRKKQTSALNSTFSPNLLDHKYIWWQWNCCKNDVFDGEKIRLTAALKLQLTAGTCLTVV